MPINLLFKYFPNLTELQIDRFQQMESLYLKWNKKVNVISRRDIDNLIERHVLHSLSITKYIQFNDNIEILDVGTGGGFPGIPLAVYYEKCQFTLIDSIGKKIRIVDEIINALGLKNVKTIQIRSENHNGIYDYIVCRAVTKLPLLIKQTKHLIKKGGGIIYLKGGEFHNEIEVLKNPVKIFDISDVFCEDFFRTKKIVNISLQ